MNPNDLKAGALYFLAGYSDSSCRVPRIETLEYREACSVGHGAEKRNQYVFRDPHEAAQTKAKEALGHLEPKDEFRTISTEIFTDEYGLQEFLDLAGLISWLQELETRMRSKT